MTATARARLSHPVFAALYPRMARGMEAGPIGTTRRTLLAAARGVVVDLGSGVGLNMPHLGPEVTTVQAVEPDPHMVRRLTPNLPPGAVVHQVGAETLPLPDASVDTVLATLTLCTVQDLAAAVREIRRVLRPDGQVLVLEHVLSTDLGVAVWQHRMRLPWRWFGAGCNPTRGHRSGVRLGRFRRRRPAPDGRPRAADNPRVDHRDPARARGDTLIATQSTARAWAIAAVSARDATAPFPSPFSKSSPSTAIELVMCAMHTTSRVRAAA